MPASGNRRMNVGTTPSVFSMSLYADDASVTVDLAPSFGRLLDVLADLGELRLELGRIDLHAVEHGAPVTRDRRHRDRVLDARHRSRRSTLLASVWKYTQ